MKSIIYEGFSKRAGIVMRIKSNEHSERCDIIRLYGIFDADTEITCIEPKTKNSPEIILDILLLKDIFNEPIL